jgi:hypothetical protein
MLYINHAIYYVPGTMIEFETLIASLVGLVNVAKEYSRKTHVQLMRKAGAHRLGCGNTRLLASVI